MIAPTIAGLSVQHEYAQGYSSFENHSPTMPASAPGGRPPPPDFPPSPEPDAPGPVPSAGRPVGPSVPGPVAAEGPMGDSTLVCPGLTPEVDVDAALSCPPNAPESPPSVGVGLVPVLAVLVLPFALGSICTGSTGSVGVGGAIGVCGCCGLKGSLCGRGCGSCTVYPLAKFVGDGLFALEVDQVVVLPVPSHHH